MACSRGSEKLGAAEIASVVVSTFDTTQLLHALDAEKKRAKKKLLLFVVDLQLWTSRDAIDGIYGALGR
jgi:hypothetical protein